MSVGAWWTGPAAQRIMPLFYDGDAARAGDVVDALHAGGARLVEYTLRGPGAQDVLAGLCARPGATVGAGSVADPDSARAAIDAGAAFIVGPNGDADVARVCSDAGVDYVPGCATPSEMVAARGWGCALVKLFPADILGPAWLKAVRGPLPDLQVMATGGVSLDTMADWFAAGAACVGMGSELVRRDLVARGEFDAIAAGMREALEAAG